MEVFRKVTMKKPVDNGIATPAGSGAEEQYMPAALADALRQTEEDEKSKPANERQNQFFKNGIEKIGKTDYFPHDETVNGQPVTVYKTTAPEPKAARAAATNGFDPTALGAAIAAGLRSVVTEQPQPDAKKATSKKAAAANAEAEKVKQTGENNTDAANSPEGAVQPDAAGDAGADQGLGTGSDVVTQ